ncbi:uncharacterized protein LOC132312854 [Cornus florida]|uniref:uncharacterized protein LOC132312854 n=1 Tax=Cornus florida TaxID=4283 RepID=UPI00289EDB99|nr:uncharacterized protein LOC132312854 [Cornus florida]
MDFQSLSRKELQTLCKKNKIPANITNIAMVDALKALEIIEGIEEILKPSESETVQSSIESPERMTIASSGVSRTGGRTSTRRKAIKEEPESSQICTRTTRRATRRTLASEVEEAKVDVSETPAVAPGTRKRVPVASARREVETQLKEGEEDQKIGDQMVHDKKDVPETPAATTGRRRGTLASARLKIETDLGKEKGSSVRRVYSTRRSVRMSETKMEEPNKKQNKRNEEVSHNTGLDMQKVSEETIEETNDSEVLSGQKSDAFAENERYGDDQKSTGDSHLVGDSNAIPEEISAVFEKKLVISVSAEHPNKLIIEKDRDVEDGVLDESKDDNSESKSEVGSKRCGIIVESDILLGEALDMKNEEEEKKVVDDSTIDRFQSVTENYIELLKENEEKLNASKDMESEDSATEVFADIVCGDVVDLAAPQSSVNAVQDLASEVPAMEDLDVNNFSASAADQDQNQDFDLEYASGEQFKGEAFSEDDAEIDPEFHGAQDEEESFNGKVTRDDVCGDVVDHAAASLADFGFASEEQFKGEAFSDDDAETDPESSNGEVSRDDAVAHSDISECLIGSKRSESCKEPETPQILDQEEFRNSSDQFIMKSNNDSEVFSGEMMVANKLNAEKFAAEESRVQVVVDFSDQGSMIFDTVNGPCQAKESMLGLEAMVDAKEQALPQIEVGADVDEATAEVPAMTTHARPSTLIVTPVSEKQNSYSHPLTSEENATDQFARQGSINFSNLMAYCHTEDPTPDAEKSHEAQVDVYEIAAQESDATTNEQDSSFLDKTSAASVKRSSHPGQISQAFCQAGSDSDIPSLPSLPPTRSGMMTHVLDDNKENIDNSGRKLDVTREKGKKNKNTASEDDNQLKSLHDASLRQLTKMLKEKLQITNEVNNYEEKNTSTGTRPRTALQKLPENRMLVGEPDKEN